MPYTELNTDTSPERLEFGLVESIEDALVLRKIRNQVRQYMTHNQKHIAGLTIGLTN